LTLGRDGNKLDPEGEGLLDGLEGETRREARADLLRELAADGATVDELREAIAEDRLTLLPLERAMSDMGEPQYTTAELAKRSGVDESYLLALRRALGLPRTDRHDRHGSERDVEAAETVQAFREAGLPDDGLLEIARVLGHGMSVLAATIYRVIAEAYLEPGDTELDAALRYAEAAKRLRPALGPLLDYALAVHQREQIGSEVVGMTELASGRLHGAVDVTVCFADLVGFTQLGEAITPAGLGEVAGRLTDHALESARPPARLVKMIGDAALLVSPDSDALILAALELMEAVTEDDKLPALRVGITRGQAISRGGEWYGTPVNIASKLTATVRGGRVLATADVRETAGGGFTWRKAGRRKLDGVRNGLDLYEVRLPAATAREPWPGYDGETVKEVREALTKADTTLAMRVLGYERRHKRRKGVLEHAERRRRRTT
jgi:adenylate cyclase